MLIKTYDDKDFVKENTLKEDIKQVLYGYLPTGIVATLIGYQLGLFLYEYDLAIRCVGRVVC